MDTRANADTSDEEDFHPKREMNKQTSSVLLITTLFAGSLAGQTAPHLGPGRKYTSIERMKIEHLRAIHADRLRYTQERRPVSIATGYKDYRAVLHAHAEDATHTGGTRPELLAAARRAGVQVVMLTDHVRPGRDFITHLFLSMALDPVRTAPVGTVMGSLPIRDMVRVSSTRPRPRARRRCATAAPPGRTSSPCSC